MALNCERSSICCFPSPCKALYFFVTPITDPLYVHFYYDYFLFCSIHITHLTLQPGARFASYKTIVRGRVGVVSWLMEKLPQTILNKFTALWIIFVKGWLIVLRKFSKKPQNYDLLLRHANTAIHTRTYIHTHPPTYTYIHSLIPSIIQTHT